MEFAIDFALEKLFSHIDSQNLATKEVKNKQ